MMNADVTILGGGPGGIAAALRAREYGFKTFLVEKEAVGGVCLHRGCIPTKSLIADASLKRSFSEMMAKKERIVSRIHQGASGTLQREGVSVIEGEGRVVREHVVKVNEGEIETKFILIATGSRPKSILGLSFDDKKILSSDTLLRIRELPKTLLIIGAGPTGCEFATLFHRLGTPVTLLEGMPFLLPGFDEETSETLKKIFVRQGIDVCVNEEVTSLQKREEGIAISTGSGANRVVEKVLVSVGRVPNSQGIGLEALRIPLKEGFIVVDETMRTIVPSIFAVGDVIGKWPLAHAASHQGRVAVDNMAGKRRAAESIAIPECVFTIPEVANVGVTEKVAREKGHAVRTGRSSFLVSAKANILEEKEGFVKLVGDAETGRLLGAHLLGPQVTELIGELTLAMRMGHSIRDIQETIHPHPTLSETIEEAARDFYQKEKRIDPVPFSDMASKAD